MILYFQQGSVYLITLEKSTSLIYFYTQFMDDIILCVNEEEINFVLILFNSIQPSIVFTLEVETNGFINFLDMTLIHAENKIMCKWYQKPTTSGGYVNH